MKDEESEPIRDEYISECITSIVVGLALLVGVLMLIFGNPI